MPAAEGEFQTVGDVRLIFGRGTPTHSDREGTLFVDVTAPALWQNADGGTTWEQKQ